MRLSLLQKRHLRPLVGIVTALLILAGAVRTVIRNRDWSDNRRLWEATYAAAPGSRRASLNLGALYFESPDPGLQRQGLEMMQRLVEQGGDDGLASSNLEGCILCFPAASLSWRTSRRQNV